MSTNNNENIDKLNEKIKQLQAKKQQLLARNKEKERKERTRKLIQIGATIGKLNITTLEHANALVKLYEVDSIFKNKLDTCLANIHNETNIQSIEKVEQNNVSRVHHSIIDD